MKDIYLEGAKGGDFIHIRERADGRVWLQVGHCCVITIDHIIPVEWLTSVLSEAVIDSGVAQALDPVKWPCEYKAELSRKIEAMPK